MRVVFSYTTVLCTKKLVVVVRRSKTNRSYSGSGASALTTKWCSVKAATGIYCEWG